MDMTEAEFDQICDTFRDPRVWRIENDQWVKDDVWGGSSSYGRSILIKTIRAVSSTWSRACRYEPYDHSRIHDLRRCEHARSGPAHRAGGAGNIADKTLRRIKGVTGIVDNNPNLAGETQAGLTIARPDSLKDAAPRPFVVICTTSFVEVGEQLVSFGLLPGQDFVVSPVLNDLRIIARWKAWKKRCCSPADCRLWRTLKPVAALRASDLRRETQLPENLQRQFSWPAPPWRTSSPLMTSAA
ncbi:MAG: hypothetical protein JKP95_03375 [Oceanicaulis sp.]|nr:hypothetical protein [Oceanicaulis sp.]